MAITGWRDAGYPAYLPAETVLDQVETAVVVTDRLNNLLYANAYAQKLFGVSAKEQQLVGRPILSLGFEVEDLGKAIELARQVLRGRAWEGTIASRRSDGSRIFVRATAVPLRHPSGAIDGVVIFAREATRRGSQREHERIGLLERIGERLAGSLELGVTLRQVADTLVPQFADHCFIDLFQGDTLVRRASAHARGWRAVEAGCRRRREQPLEGTGDRELCAAEHGRDRPRPREIGARLGVGRQWR